MSPMLVVVVGVKFAKKTFLFITSVNIMQTTRIVTQYISIQQKYYKKIVFLLKTPIPFLLQNQLGADC